VITQTLSCKQERQPRELREQMGDMLIENPKQDFPLL